MPRRVAIKNKALDAGGQEREHHSGMTQNQKEIKPEVKAMMNIESKLNELKQKMKEDLELISEVRDKVTLADEMIEIIEQNHSKIEKYLKGTKYEREPGELKETDKILELGQEIINLGLCVRLSRTNDSKLLKWPKELLFKPGNIQFTKKSCFLTFMFEPDPRKRHIKLFFIIVGILCLALYPIWPLQLRILVFKVSFYLLIGLLILTIVRYFLFGLFWICGVHFWIFPNLYADVGFIDSFKPIFSTGYQFEKNVFAYLGRIGIIVLYGFTIWYYLTYYDQFLNLRAGYSAGMQDIYDWGETKIAMKPTEPNLENFRRTRNWYDEMMDEWTKEDPPPEQKTPESEPEKTQTPQEEETQDQSKDYLDYEEKQEDDDDDEDDEEEEDPKSQSQKKD